MKIAVVVPAHNGAIALKKCLTAITGSSREPDQVIVVDDGSTDPTVCKLASEFEFDYFSVPAAPAGPANARNLGVGQTKAELVLFVDSDVVLARDSIEKVVNVFSANPDTHALFGSYDSSPAVTTTVSRYKNLLHHFVHQQGNHKASTFWSGFGAARREVFLAVGGFDRSYRKPCIEDIEFGARLVKAGYTIQLCPEIQVKHLKHWTLTGMIHTDIFCRAIPWTKMMINQNIGVSDDLNTSVKSRVSAIAAILFSLSLVCVVAGYPLHHITMFFLGAYISLDWKLFKFFQRTGGWRLAVGGAALHLIYYLYASITFVSVHLVDWCTKAFSRIVPSWMNTRAISSLKNQ